MTTPLDALITALATAADYNTATEAAPAAVLWCDERREFAGLIPALRARMPHLLTYGDIDTATRAGPAIWLRAAIAGAIPGLAWSPGTVPVIWLPGVARETLRAAEECPARLVPLAWLAVAGSFFGHINGKDWTLAGFLGAERGPLKLDVAGDGATRQALIQAAPTLFARPLDALARRRIDEPFLHDLIMPDPAADMLRWLEGEEDPARLPAIAKWAKAELGFDVRKHDRSDAAALLARQQGGWAKLWSRFSTNPGFHEPIVKLLYTVTPDLASDGAAYPAVNDDREAELHGALLKTGNLAPAEARAAIAKLEVAHHWRRHSVWAGMGRAPLALALEHLAKVATPPVMQLHDAKSLGDAYAENGWRIDDAALAALAAAPRLEDRTAVAVALRAIYLPWLNDTATALQGLAASIDFTHREAPTKEATVLFVDGLRMDLAQRLCALLTADGAKVTIGWQWSGFPTVTATCKPLASPVAAEFTGTDPAAGFMAQSADGKPVVQAVLRKTLEAAGWSTESDLLGADRAWLEAGTFDGDGHSLGVRLVDALDKALRDVADITLRLARQGRQVRIVTDHGWLLVPGGLDAAKIEAGLTEPNSKWARCAVVKPGAKVSLPQFRWTWNNEAWIATAAGACAFFNKVEYAHGGISLQECVIPTIVLQPLATKAVPTIVETTWKGMRLNVRVLHAAGMRVDLRLGLATGTSIAAAVKDVEPDGAASLLINYDYEGKDAILVVLDAAGAVVARQAMKVAG
jgi:hypothetical protein